jgi:hypothetical protein
LYYCSSQTTPPRFRCQRSTTPPVSSP